MVQASGTIRKPDKKSGFQMVSKTDLRNVRFSNESGFGMVGFRIPTVKWLLFLSTWSKEFTFGSDSYHFCWVLKQERRTNHYKNLIQWGSEIRTSLDFKWLKRGWVANGLNFKLDLKSWSPTIWNSDKWPPFCQKPLEIWTKMSRFWMVQFSNGWGYRYVAQDNPNR